MVLGGACWWAVNAGLSLLHVEVAATGSCPLSSSLYHTDLERLQTPTSAKPFNIKASAVTRRIRLFFFIFILFSFYYFVLSIKCGRVRAFSCTVHTGWSVFMQIQIKYRPEKWDEHIQQSPFSHLFKSTVIPFMHCWLCRGGWLNKTRKNWFMCCTLKFRLRNFIYPRRQLRG